MNGTRWINPSHQIHSRSTVQRHSATCAWMQTGRFTDQTHAIWTVTFEKHVPGVPSGAGSVQFIIARVVKGMGRRGSCFLVLTVVMR